MSYEENNKYDSLFETLSAKEIAKTSYSHPFDRLTQNSSTSIDRLTAYRRKNDANRGVKATFAKWNITGITN